MTTVRSLPLITGSQNGYVQHNVALREIAALSFGEVISTISTPPSSPTLHDTYQVGVSPSGAWASYTVGSLAYWNSDNQWVEYPANNGLRVYHKANNSIQVYSSGAWINFPVVQTDVALNLPSSGVQTLTFAAHAQNRLFLNCAAVTASTISVNIDVGSGFNNARANMSIFLYDIPGAVTSVGIGLTNNTPTHSTNGVANKVPVAGGISFSVNKPSAVARFIVS